MNPMGKYIIERNRTPENVLYMVDNEKCLCQHGKFHPLTDIKGNIFQKKCIEILKKPPNKTHINTSLQREEKVYYLEN